ncbi:hypothetical protein GALMADRAFT_240970 [Galerina marginata CBS 339.88]|uniref:chitin deacetylase n=1 Tax=Galerina marginata (strain CBS 339.88) TaxID=685588 RepID=A0A067TE47_GALM3|nr:hypothetical protein GALMADRAFT_240970 [Galerina marginata CBS 339.88]
MKLKLNSWALLSTLPGLALAKADPFNNRHAHLVRQAATTAPPLATFTGIPPLSSITMGMATRPPPQFVATHSPGATPPISGAPVLPTSLVLTGWPIADKVPDTNSPEVQAWMKELDGIHIPDIPPTKDSNCAADPAAAADAAKRGWWTCGGYTRSTDIVACPKKLDWGVSFDDGPSPYKPNLLAKLKEKNVKATFFVVGSRVIERPGMLIEEYMTGHEISVHTWSHASLTTLTNAQIVAELGWTRKAIRTVLGVTPTTMRPPKGDIDDRVRAISLAMGMVPILWTSTPDGGKFDSNDWRVAGGLVTGPQAFSIFEDIMRNATTFNTGFVTLQHDLFEITVDLAVGYTLDVALSHQPKFALQRVGECMGIPEGNLYRETNQNTSFPYTNLTAGGLDVDGDGKVDIKNSGKNAASPISIPLWGSLSVVGLAVVNILL